MLKYRLRHIRSQKVWIFTALILPILAILYTFVVHFHRDDNYGATIEIAMGVDNNESTTADPDKTIHSSPTYSIAHLGNSIQYYNDCPRVLEKMLLSTTLGRVTDLDNPERKSIVRSDSCLRGGSTLPSLWKDGNGMAKKFASRPESIIAGDDGFDIGTPTVFDLLKASDTNLRYWDFIVVNDYTQSPARNERKQESKTALETHYLPAIADGMEASRNDGKGVNTTTTVVFLQTAAYKTPVKNSADLGSFDDFTKALEEGYDEYVALTEVFAAQRFPTGHPNTLKATVAPLGRAYQIIRDEHHELWSKAMYANDGFHPSPHGTLLEACILHCIVTGGQKFAFFEDQDDDSGMDDWWKQARYLQPLQDPNGDPQKPLRFPTRTEAVLLNDIAFRVYLERQDKEGKHKKQ